MANSYLVVSVFVMDVQMFILPHGTVVRHFHSLGQVLMGNLTEEVKVIWELTREI